MALRIALWLNLFGGIIPQSQHFQKIYCKILGILIWIRFNYIQPLTLRLLFNIDESAAPMITTNVSSRDIELGSAGLLL